MGEVYGAVTCDRREILLAGGVHRQPCVAGLCPPPVSLITYPYVFVAGGGRVYRHV